MLLRLGTLKKYSRLGENTDARLYEVLAAEIAKLERKKPQRGKPSRLSLESPINFKNIQSVVGNITGKNKSFKSLPKIEGGYSPRLSNISDPLMMAAEKLLVKSDIITRKKGYKAEEYLKSHDNSPK